MAKEKQIKGTSFRIPVELMHNFKVKCAQQHTNQTAIVIQAIEGFLGSKQETSSQLRIKEASNADAEWHAMLDEVLADQEERIGIEKNLTWAVQAVRSRKKASAKAASRR